MAKRDLTRNPGGEEFKVPPPAQPTPGITGQFPLAAGRVIQAKSTTPGEQAILDKLGYLPGDPVPENLAARIDAARKAAEREATDLDAMPPPSNPDLPPLQIPKETPIDALSPQAQAELRASLASAKDFAEQASASLHPSVQSAVETTDARETEVVDDRNDATYAGTSVPKRATPEEDPTGVHAFDHFCPHCGWDTTKREGFEVTDFDRQAFLAAVLGGQPYRKVYTLLGGRAKITIRSLSPREWDECARQANRDLEGTPLDSPMARWERAQAYHTALQTSRIQTTSMEEDLPDSIDEWVVPEGQPPLPLILADFVKNITKSDSLYRIAIQTANSFNRLVAALEAHYDNPDFWNAADSAT